MIWLSLTIILLLIGPGPETFLFGMVIGAMFQRAVEGELW